MGNVYLEKIAKELETRQKVGLAEIGVLGTGGGAWLAHNQYRGGHLTGRESFYHGTSPARAELIREQGLHPGKHVGSTQLVEEMNGHPRGGLGSGKLVFMARDRFTANQFIDQAMIAEKGGPEALAAHLRKGPLGLNVKGLLQRQFGIGSDTKGFVEANIPLWKEKDIKVVPNPEAEALKKNPMFKIMNGMSDADIDKHFETSVLTVDGHIPAHHIIGGKGYQKNSLKEIGQFIKANPKRFLVEGVGKTAVGAGLAVGSPLAALGLKHHIEKQAAPLSQSDDKEVMKGTYGYLDQSSKDGWAAGALGAAVGGVAGYRRPGNRFSDIKAPKIMPIGGKIHFVPEAVDVSEKAFGAYRGAKAFGTAGALAGSAYGLGKAIAHNKAMHEIKAKNPEGYDESLAASALTHQPRSNMMTHPLTMMVPAIPLPAIAGLTPLSTRLVGALAPTYVNVLANIGENKYDEAKAKQSKDRFEASMPSHGIRVGTAGEEVFSSGGPLSYDADRYEGKHHSVTAPMAAMAVGGIGGAAHGIAKNFGEKELWNDLKMYQMADNTPLLNKAVGRKAAIGAAALGGLGVLSSYLGNKTSRNWTEKADKAGISREDQKKYQREIHGRESELYLSPGAERTHRLLYRGGM